MVPDLDELGQLLLRRQRCLHALTANPQPKRSLVDQLDIPRSTLDGIMRDLNDADLVAYTDGKWHVTLLGQCALHVHEQYVSQLASLTDIASFGDALSPRSPVPCEFLIGADVHEADTAILDDVIPMLLESVADATRIRGFTPTVISAYAESFYTRATTGDEYQLDLVLPLDIFERLRTMYPDQTHEALHDTQVSLLHGSIPVSFGLWIADNTHAGIIVYAEQGVRGLIINDTDEALAWAENQYERVQRDAEPFFLRGGVRRAPSHS